MLTAALLGSSVQNQATAGRIRTTDLDLTLVCWCWPSGPVSQSQPLAAAVDVSRLRLWGFGRTIVCHSGVMPCLQLAVAS